MTPFTSGGGIDFAALERLVAHVTKGGADYLVALGTTAETATLAPEERCDVLACIKASNTAGLPVVAGIGGNDTAAVARAFGQFDLSGVTAILSVTPYYNKPTQEGLYRHYKALAADAPLPLILYNVPGRTGVNMSAQTTLRLAHDCPNVIATKEACGSAGQVSYILRDRPEGFAVISGDDNMAAPMVALGGDGVISVSANAFPAKVSAMVKAGLNGDMTLMASLHMQLLEATDALFEEGNPAGVKTALAIKGVCSHTVRLPLVAGSDGLREKLEKLINLYDL